MSRYLDLKPKQNRLRYDRANLQRAYQATQTGLSVYRAARQFSVPESSLRDRTMGKVCIDATVGTKTLFTRDEEQKLVNNITYMADIGYGYNKASIQHMAQDYSKYLGKKMTSSLNMSHGWFYRFMKRWPGLKIVKPQKLSIARAKSASRESIDAYYHELGNVLTINNSMNKPQSIYNIDETGISTEHAPPKIVCNKDTTPQCVTSARTSNVTIIAGGNAIGNSIPPFYVFPGKRWNNGFMIGASVGSDGIMSKNGWSNTDIFNTYLTQHFSKYVNLSNGPTLILYDGHKSHISLTLADWPRKNNVILFVLPPHTSHITQPLDVGVFGPFKNMYNTECHAYMKENPGYTITKYQVAQLTAKPFVKSLSTENLTSGFRKTGIYPFIIKVIAESHLAPSMIYQKKMINENDEREQIGEAPKRITFPTASDSQTQENDEVSANTFETIQFDDESNICTSQKTDTSATEAPLAFFKGRTITTSVTRKPKRKICAAIFGRKFILKKPTSTYFCLLLKSKRPLLTVFS